ncbi:MAG: hypothetical protein RIR97_2087, partial [Pseudomonadota bacterium]
ERITMRIRVYRLLEGGGKGKDAQVEKIRAAHAPKKESIFTKSFGTCQPDMEGEFFGW